MAKRLFVAILLAIVCCGAAQQNFARWEKQNSNTLAWLRALHFFDQTRGFVVGGNGTILRTTDGGATWTRVESQTRDNLRDIVFTSDSDGWILAERSEFALRKNEKRSYLLRTTDGGATWRAANFPGNNLNALLVRFVADANKQKIWAVGETGTLYALVNNGTTWQKQAAPTEYLLLGGFSLGEQQNWLVGAGGSLLTTADGGATWRAANAANASASRLNAVFFASARAGWAVGANGTILATTNNNLWRAQNSGVAADLLDVQFIDKQNGWIAGAQNVLLKTTDGGATWQTENAPESAARLERLFFVRSNKIVCGWAVGFGGTILKTQVSPQKSD